MHETIIRDTRKYIPGKKHVPNTFGVVAATLKREEKNERLIF